ncbi:MAG: efflux RND transporter periplasmic adaptor subunit [Alphaproteobacteria bacterium]|nr:efflux RND transporter periplasmic adaptor subunit [Alphaproteobacteria bacterium]
MTSSSTLTRAASRAFPLFLATLLACSGGGGGPGGGPGGKGGKGGKGGMEEGQEPDRRVLVEAAPVARGEVSDHLVTTGSLESEAQADIVPEATGVVTQLLVEEGDQVKKGQLLAVLSNPSLEAGAQRAKLELERAETDAQTARDLHGRGAISDTDLRTAEQALATARTAFSEAAATAGFTRIDAPIAGTVSVRNLRVGEVAGGTMAFQIVDLSRLRVMVQLPEKDLARVREGQPVVLQGAYDEDARGTGVVRRISPVVDPQSGTVRVTIDVDADTTDLRPGQFVKVRVEVDRHDDVLTIPRRALVWIDGDPVAWKVVEGKAKADEEEGEDAPADGAEEKKEEGGLFAGLFGDEEKAGEDGEDDQKDEPPPWPLREAERADLEIGFQDPQLVEVISGLDEGDLVVTIGNGNLRGGTPLRLPDDPGPEAARKKDGGEDGEDGKAEDADKADADKADADTETTDEGEAG